MWWEKWRADKPAKKVVGESVCEGSWISVGPLLFGRWDFIGGKVFFHKSISSNAKSISSTIIY